MNPKDWTLVTGGSGFVGLALTKRLLELGHSVRIICRSHKNDSSLDRLSSYTSKGNFDIFLGDIREKQTIDKAFVGVTRVYHLAALLNSTLPLREFEVANVLATSNICELCLQHRILKLVYTSTSDVFGLPGPNELFDETSPYRFWSEPYADTKIRATKIVKDFMTKGLKTTIIYPGWVYGPGDHAFLPAVLKQIRSGIMPVWDGGKFEISFVYIDDLVSVLIQVLEKPESDNDDFIILNASSNTNFESLCLRLSKIFNLHTRIVRLPYFVAYAIACISQTLCKIKLTKTPMMSTTEVKSFGHPFKFNTDKARLKLGWANKMELQNGLNNWKSWFDNQNRIPPYESL